MTREQEDGGGYVPRGDDRRRWSRAAAGFEGDDSALSILGHPVMERWEEPFMEKLASIACANGGRVLEVGFGLGISASSRPTRSASTSSSRPTRRSSSASWSSGAARGTR